MKKFALFSALLFSTFSVAPSIAASKQIVRFATWPAPAKNAGLIIAEADGMFAKRDLENTLIEGYQNTLIILQSGEADIAQVLCSNAVTAIQKGLPGVIIAARDQRNPIATVSLPENGIRSPADYKGKRWGHSPGFSPEREMLKRLANTNGYAADEIQLVNTDFPARLPALLRGDVGFISAWLGSGYPVVSAAARKAGKQLTLIKWEDFGVRMYGECYVARTVGGTLPSWVGSWLAAARDGHLAVVRDSKRSGEKVLNAAKNVGDRDAFWDALDQATALLTDESRSEDSILAINETKMQETVEWTGGSTDGITKLLYRQK